MRKRFRGIVFHSFVTAGLIDVQKPPCCRSDPGYLVAWTQPIDERNRH
jgi:hypothetical protein